MARLRSAAMLLIAAFAVPALVNCERIGSMDVWILSPENEQLSRDNMRSHARVGSGVAIGRGILRRFAELLGSRGVICVDAAELANRQYHGLLGHSRHQGDTQTRCVGCAPAAQSRARRGVLAQLVASRRGE